MGELRKDYILDRWVLYSMSRGTRPHELQQIQTAVQGICFFCPGNEHLTPPELGRIGTKDSWRVRWFANKFAALEPTGNPEPHTENKFFTFANNYGYHEVIVETPQHPAQLAELSVAEIADVLGVYQQRIADLGKRKNIAYVSVIKNHGYQGGTSIVHTHSQVFATAIVPPAVREKIAAVRRFLKCPYCDIIAAEKDSERRCFENKEWVAFCPYASRYNDEVWIFPKKHIRTLAQANLDSLADILQRVLARLSAHQISYNYALTYAPEGEDLHFHIEVMPQASIWGGFERGSGAIINAVLPEEAAKFYRGQEH